MGKISNFRVWLNKTAGYNGGNTLARTRVPRGIKLIVALSFIGLFFFSSSYLPQRTNEIIVVNDIFHNMFGSFYFGFILFGILLIKKYNWVRILLIIMSCLRIAELLFFWPTSHSLLVIVSLLVILMLVVYLIFDKNVRITFNSDRILFKEDLFWAILMFIVFAIISIFVSTSNHMTNPYGWNKIDRTSNQEFGEIVNYKFTNGLERISIIQEAGRNAWRSKIIDGVESRVVYENWLQTVYGLPQNVESKAYFKIYLEKISKDTWNNYVKEIQVELADSRYKLNDAEYYFSWTTSSSTPDVVGYSYILFPDKNLGIYLTFFDHQMASRDEAINIIQELINHITGAKSSEDTASSTISLKTLSFIKGGEYSEDTYSVKYGTTTSTEIGTAPYELEVAKVPGYVGIEKYEQDSGYYYVNIGVVKNGVFKDKEILACGTMSDGACDEQYLISIGEDKFIGFNVSDKTFTFKQINYPEEITFPGTDSVLRKDLIRLNSGIISFPGIDFSKAKKTFEVDGIKFYVLNIYGEDSIVTDVPNGIYLRYQFDYPIRSKSEWYLLNFKLNDGRDNEELYHFGIPSSSPRAACGLQTIVQIDNINSGDYKVVGKTSDNKNVYSFANPNNEFLKDIYYYTNNSKKIFYTSDLKSRNLSGLGLSKIDPSKYSYQEFISFNPILFWQDALGNWIRFVNKKIAYEC